ncbi:metallophosphoesterase family protein [Butyrivibrio sp. NC2002]|uniref:metallophosphoesterase family protein n=1 Tax=Butyrivibrio sp. NC2002 TaxID=1410610 RepID=UPI000690F56E|nr:metallophosphoesterase family protein [Butyrivibrio sp. NC2002]
MNIAVLSDIHGNHIALRESLNFLENKDIDAYCFLGDYTGEFPGIEETMKMLYDLRDSKTCYFLRGNKENYQIDELGEDYPEWDAYPSTIGMLRYAHKHLTKEDVEFFNSLPITMTLKTEGMPDVVICHGSPRKVNEKFANNEQSLKEVVAETNAEYIICGHTHYRMETRVQDTYIWNPGSVGASCDVPYSYRFMIIHDSAGKWEPEFISLEADTEMLIAEMKKAGIYETAPYWTRFTQLLVTGKCGDYTHGAMLNRAMDLCYEKYGECNWPMIPEECYAAAFEEIVSECGEIRCCAN